MGEVGRGLLWPIDELFAICTALLHAAPATRLLFTSREALPAPFDRPRHLVTLGALSRGDAVALVSQVMADHGWTLPPTDAGRTPDDVAALVEAVNRHPRALVLLAREVTQRGVTAATADLAALMADLERKHPGDRENSLYASLELSLRRLPPEMQELIKPLAVFHDGGHQWVIAQVLEIDPTTISNILIPLSNVGLATQLDYGYWRLDPALPTYLRRHLDAATLAAATRRWAEAMQQLTGFLYQQAFKDAQLAFRLTLLELPNLLALLTWAAEHAPPETTVTLATNLETLLAQLHRPQALAQVVAMRERASAQLGTWSHQAFEAQHAAIERLQEQGNLGAALAAAQALLDRCQQAGENAYGVAAYDIALAHALLGRVLRRGGAAQAALPYLQAAQHRFQRLADDGNSDAAGMAPVTLTEQGDCLAALGRLDAAAAAYEERIRRGEKLDDRRGVAVGNGQLATVRLLQRRYDAALAGYAEARRIFSDLNEPQSLAVIWHQTGMAHLQAGDLAAAERAYREGLQIRVQIDDQAGQADSLVELGNLYAALNRLEEAVAFHRQAADLYGQMENQAREGRARSNMADELIKLGRYDEALSELRRAIECAKPFGHAAEPWKTYAILHDLERAVGNAAAAAQARQQAMALYRAYRVDGGESQSQQVQWFTYAQQVIAQGQAAQAKADLLALKEDDDPEFVTVLIDALAAVLDGVRDPALAADARLTYRDAVEVGLLLAALGQDTTTGP